MAAESREAVIYAWTRGSREIRLVSTARFGLTSILAALQTNVSDKLDHLCHSVSNNQGRVCKEAFDELHALLSTSSELLNLLFRLVDKEYAAPGLEAFLKIFEKYLDDLSLHLQPFDSMRTNTFACIPVLGSYYLQDIRLDIRKLTGFIHMFQIAVRVQKELGGEPNRLCPFLMGKDEEGTDAEETIELFDLYPFFSSFSKIYRHRLRFAFRAIMNATAAASHALEYDGLLRPFVFACSSMFYLYFPSRAIDKYVTCLDETGFKVGRFTWNLPEAHGIKQLIRATYKYVSTYEKVWIPNRRENQGTSGIVDLPSTYDVSTHPIKIRLISSRPISPEFIKHTTERANRASGSVSNTASLSELESQPHAAGADLSVGLILYFHGGGFIAMTSFSHEMYTRKWAIDTDMPFVSVDYRLAPEYPFPVQLHECYQVYQWALENAAALGSTAHRVVLVGDSAGGNLAVAVTLRAIHDGIRVPDGIVLAYPALVLTPAPSMSRLCALIDPLLNAKVMLHAFDSYVPEGLRRVADKNPFLSPAVATDDVLRRFPPARIVVGEFDPLLDDSVYFYRRLARLGRDVVISVQEGYGHGFLNMVSIIPDINSILDLVSIWLLELTGA